MTAAHQLPLDLDAALPAGSAEQAAAEQPSRRPGRRGAKLAAVPPQSDSEPPEPVGRSKDTGEGAEGRTAATYVCETSGKVYPFGGQGGASQHSVKGEATCGPCRESEREAQRRKRRKAGKKPLSAVEGEPGTYRCDSGRYYREGTNTGAGRHIKLGEDVCEPCRESRLEHHRRRRRKAGMKPRSAVEGDRGTYRCDSDRVYREGTTSGAGAHRKRGEEVCPPCREAQREAGRTYGRSEKGRRRDRNRREQKRRAHIEWVPDEVILAKTDGRCWLCGIVLDLDNRNADNGFHVDHIWALNVGGLGWEPNLAAACGSCNKSKNDRILDFRYIWIGLIPPPHLWLEDREWPDVPPRSEWVLDGRAAEVDQMMQRIGARERFTPPPAPAKWKAFRQAGIRPTGKMKRQFKAAITKPKESG